MIITGWGKNTTIESKKYVFSDIKKLKLFIKKNQNSELLARGNGRSYGDSSLSKVILDMRKINKIIDFDQSKGLLKVEAGATFEKILLKIINKGWIIPVLAGTKFITIGGAVSSDIHGKNHDICGCISDHIMKITYIDKKGEIKKTSKNKAAFKAICGGMGLVAVIIDVTIKLKKISSELIEEKIIKTTKLNNLISTLSENKTYEYSVGWIDLINFKDKNKLNSIIFLGNHYNDNNKKISYKKQSIKNYNHEIISLFMNNFFLGVFNKLYFYKNRNKVGFNNIEKFFFPLDKIANWNSYYGKKGFLQYQFVVPRKNIYKVFDKILTLNIKPFLCVIKIFKKPNNNYLSFPSNGISLAMDLHNNDMNIKKLNLLNELITKLGGKIYLTKDSILKKNEFRKMYPNWNKILKINSGLFLSIQTKRLGYK